MNSLTLIFATACLFAIAYRFYGLFLANKVMNLREERDTPAVMYEDGHDYLKTNKYVLFGHHFAAIAASTLPVWFLLVPRDYLSTYLKIGTIGALALGIVFILTAVDAGTRVGRYLLQEMLGKLYAPFSDNSWTPGIILTSALFTSAWGYLVYNGDISTIWPLFGMSNQLLATCALIVGTTMLIRLGKARYAWVTAGPGLFMMPICMWAGYLNITDNFLPKGLYLLASMSVILIVLMTVVFIEAFRRWHALLQFDTTVADSYGDQVLALATEREESVARLPMQE